MPRFETAVIVELEVHHPPANRGVADQTSPVNKGPRQRDWQTSFRHYHLPQAAALDRDWNLPFNFARFDTVTRCILVHFPLLRRPPKPRPLFVALSHAGLSRPRTNRAYTTNTLPEICLDPHRLSNPAFIKSTMRR